MRFIPPKSYAIKFGAFSNTLKTSWYSVVVIIRNFQGLIYFE